jgi:tRNA (pseudouridine54-N1)-methyltransferase
MVQMRVFVVLGQTATAASDFLLDDLPGSSGRLDVLLRCVRAALLYSHGLRSDVRVYLLLRGGPLAPRVLRVDSKSARFIRPDERSLALLVKKTLASAPGDLGSTFMELRPGIALARGDLECILADVPGAALYVLEERAPDVSSLDLRNDHAAYFLGDHLGIDPADRDRLAALGATAVSIGPVSLHSDDVIAVLSNQLDRLEAHTGSPRLPGVGEPISAEPSRSALGREPGTGAPRAGKQ